MGWASGSELMGSIVGALQKQVKDKKVRKKIYETLIPEFESADCDTLYECCGSDEAYDEVFEKLNP